MFDKIKSALKKTFTGISDMFDAIIHGKKDKSPLARSVKGLFYGLVAVPAALGAMVVGIFTSFIAYLITAAMAFFRGLMQCPALAILGYSISLALFAPNFLVAFTVYYFAYNVIYALGGLFLFVGDLIRDTNVAPTWFKGYFTGLGTCEDSSLFIFTIHEDDVIVVTGKEV